MKKVIIIFWVLISLTTMAKFEEQYGANEIKIETFKDGGSRKLFALKDNIHVCEVTTFPSNKLAEIEFQKHINEIEKRKLKILDYIDIVGTKKIIFLTDTKIVTLSKTMDEITQLVLDRNDLDKTEEFADYLKLNGVHGSIELTILNAKMKYKMRDKK